MTKTVVNIEVVEAEKRRVPSKHYVYVIVVKWSDNSSMVVYRRYSRFFDLQTQLLDKFPVEAGATDPTLRIVPFLPGKIFFGRSQVRDVAMKRLGEIDEYCKNLLALPPHLSQSEEVLSFFEVEPDDLDPPKEEPEENLHKRHFSFDISKQKAEKKAEKISGPKQLEQFVAISDYEVQDKGEMNLQAGMVVEVTEKSESGWWFVNAEEQQGWVPSTYLQPLNGSGDKQAPVVKDGEEEKFICIENYAAENEDEISLDKGVIVEVKQKNTDGWWTVKYQGREGFAPATYLKKSNDPYAQSLVRKSRESGVKIISNLSDVSNLIASSSSSPRNSGIFIPRDPATASESSHSSARREEGGRGFSKAEGSDEERIVTQKETGPKGNLMAKVLMKQLSLERGGSLKPPPRQNSITKLVVQPTPPSPSSRLSTYMTVCDFEDTVGDGISFSAGESVTVLEKTASGWWFVEREGDQGWVPESYLQESPAAGRQSTSSLDMNPVEEDSDEEDEESDDDDDDDDDAADDALRQPPSAALANALNSRLKKIGDNSSAAPANVLKPAGKTSPKPPSLPSKPKTESEGDGDKQQDSEPATGLASALKSRFESNSKPSGWPNKPPEKPGPLSLPNKPGGKPGPPSLPSKPSDSKPGPPDLPSKPFDKPSLPNKVPDKPVPSSLANKTGPPSWQSNKPSEKPKPPGLPSKPTGKPSGAEASETSGVSGGVAGLTGALRARFESQQQEEDRPSKSFAKPSLHNSKPAPPGKFSNRRPGSSQGQPDPPSWQKPSVGSKPWTAQKPGVNGGVTPGKPQFPPSKTPSSSGPPSLPSKPQFGSKSAASDSNNNTSGGVSGRPMSSKVQGMAAALGKMGVGQNSSSSSSSSSSAGVRDSGSARPSLPVKKPSLPDPPPGQKTGAQSSETAAAPGKPRVGNLVSELGSKLNFGGGGGGFGGSGGGGGDASSNARNPEPSPVSKSSPWSAKGGVGGGGDTPPKPAPPVKAQPIVPAAVTTGGGGGGGGGGDNSGGAVGEEFEAVADFAAEGDGELALQCGDIVTVLDTRQADWWLVSLHGEEGWVPQNYLEPAPVWDD